MELKNTILWNKTRPQNNKIWNEHEMFPQIKTNLDNIQKELTKQNITKVVCLDQLGTNWKEWKIKKGLTLVILPLTNIINQQGTKTKKILKKIGLKNKKIYYPIDIEHTETSGKVGFVEYFPTRNLIITTINPFADEQVLKIVIENIKVLKPKHLTQEQIWEKEIKEQWEEDLERREENIQLQIRDCQQRIAIYTRDIEMEIARRNELKKEVEINKKVKNNLTKHLKEELKKIKALPVIKTLEITDKLKVSFGTIYLHGEVQTGTTEKGGIKVPKIEVKRVEIGKLEFTIQGQNIRVTNDKSVDGIRHPHAEGTNICFGEVKPKAIIAQRSLQLHKLIMLLYIWAHSYNAKDAYVTLQRFYDAREKEKKQETLEEAK